MWSCNILSKTCLALSSFSFSTPFSLHPPFPHTSCDPFTFNLCSVTFSLVCILFFCFLFLFSWCSLLSLHLFPTLPCYLNHFNSSPHPPLPLPHFLLTHPYLIAIILYSDCADKQSLTGAAVSLSPAFLLLHHFFVSASSGEGPRLAEGQGLLETSQQRYPPETLWQRCPTASHQLCPCPACNSKPGSGIRVHFGSSGAGRRVTEGQRQCRWQW